MKRLFYRQEKVNLQQIYTQVYDQRIHFFYLYARLLSMNKLWIYENRSIFQSHVAHIFFKHSPLFSTQLVQHMFPSFFNNLTSSFFLLLRERAHCVLLYDIINDTIFVAIHFSLPMSFRARAHRKPFLPCFIRG